MADIAGNIDQLRSQIPESVRIIAVSKTRPVSDILEAYNTGQRDFGENRVQEILKKREQLPGDIRWHLIGHLQTNKVRSVVPYVHMIHSVDSLKLLSAIDAESARISRVTDCLLQVHIAQEETKSGFSYEELIETVGSPVHEKLVNTRICGLMGMATFTDDVEQVKKEFRFLAGCFNDIKSRYFAGREHFKELSMGMSGDYMTAIGEGSTMVRIGSLIFGERIKTQ